MRKSDDYQSEPNIKRKIIWIVVVYMAAIAFAVAGCYFQKIEQASLQNQLIFVGGFFACLILGVILLIINAGEFVFSELEYKRKRYDQKQLTQIKHCSQDEIKSSLEKHKFKCHPKGYYHKRNFSCWKDYVHYYVKFVVVEPSFDGEERMKKLIRAINREANRFKALRLEGNRQVLLLFLYQQMAGASELSILKENAICAMLSNELDLGEYEQSFVPVLVADETKIGYFMDMPEKINIGIYKHGCKMVKSVLD